MAKWTKEDEHNLGKLKENVHREETKRGNILCENRTPLYELVLECKLTDETNNSNGITDLLIVNAALFIDALEPFKE